MTMKLVSGQQHAPAAIYTREGHGTHFTGGWGGPRAGLDGWKVSSPPGIFYTCCIFSPLLHLLLGHAVAQFAEALRNKPEVRGSDRFPMASLEFFIGIILPAALWPWG